MDMNDNKPRVYVVQEQGKLDYSDAERFGEVKFLTRFEYNGLRNSHRNKLVTSDIRLGLADFHPDRDYLLMTGSPVSMGYAFWLVMLKASQAGHSKLNILQWDRESYQYRHIVFEI